MKKFLSVILAVMMVAAVMPFAYAAESFGVAVLYTNDIHCAIDAYPVLAAYEAKLAEEGYEVIIVDAGDAVQGEIIGSQTEGEAIVDIMNAVGYDYAVPGNHEFDFGMERFLELAQTKADYEYISTNFYHLPTVDPVFAPYAIEDFGAYQVAFIGISTPETISKSTPEYFKDENGNFIYGFPLYPGGMTDEALYENIQESVDAAVADGADIVVALGHTGELETTEGWRTSDIIANTSGIDYYIDAHSHETVESETYKNKNNEDVIRTSTGTKFANFGVLKISGSSADFELINPDEVNVETMSDNAKSAYNTVKAKVDGYNEMIEELYREIGTSEAKLVAYDADMSWAVRKRETNAGDFVADAYRAVTGADVAIVNGGGVRAEIEVGGVSLKNLMDMNAFNNEMCVIEVTGQQLIDVLEHGARECPESLGSFFQVSGVTFEIHTDRESPVICDSLENFIGIDATMQRRVENVKVGGEPLELDATYTLAGSAYLLTQNGGGLTMLSGATVVQSEGLPCDSEMLIEYFTETLGGVITAEKYGNPDGDGRIAIVSAKPNTPEHDYEIELGNAVTVSVECGEEICIKFVPEKTAEYIFRTESYETDTAACLFYSNGEEIFGDYDDDTEESCDFRLKYECEAGEEYYLKITTYSENTETFKVIVDCGHSYDENGECVVCGNVCDHAEVDFLGFCSCGKVYVGEDIANGDELELEGQPSGRIFWHRFTCDVSGYYSLKSVSEGTDPVAYLYDAQGDNISVSDDVKGLDFDLIYYYEAGETYYFDIHNLSGEGTFSVTFDRIVHTADDGSEHTDFEVVEGSYSNCTEHGYTNGLYCNDCEEYVYGYEELPLNESWHIDEGGDDVCDRCGAKLYCEHMCHRDGIVGFFWKIINFFNKLFGLNPVCVCGNEHY